MAGARDAALRALIAFRRDGAWPESALKDALRGMDRREAALATRLCNGVLQNRMLLDHWLSGFVRGKLQPVVRDILRLAAYQLCFLDRIPPSAAVNEAVKLTRTFKKASASGLVNAVLRKACNYDLETARFRNETQRLMVLGSAGQDVAEFLRTHYPEEALGILTHTADGGCTSLRANCLKMDAAALCEKLLESGVKSAQPGLVPGSVLAKFEGSPAEHPLFKEGCFHVEGQASQLAALCVEAKPGDTVIDLCAAPGGKTLLLAEEMQGQGALYSCDVAEHRVGLIRSAVERMGFAHVTALCNDATRPNPKLPAADRILVDVPCSGLGILAKKPDIRYKDMTSLAGLPAIQSAILDNASRYVRRGGTLVYSTCTVLPEENERVTDAFLRAHPDFTYDTFALPGPIGTVEGHITLWPQRHGTDGFYICRMTRKE